MNQTHLIFDCMSSVIWGPLKLGSPIGAWEKLLLLADVEVTGHVENNGCNIHHVIRFSFQNRHKICTHWMFRACIFLRHPLKPHKQHSLSKILLAEATNFYHLLWEKPFFQDVNIEVESKPDSTEGKGSSSPLGSDLTISELKVKCNIVLKMFVPV